MAADYNITINKNSDFNRGFQVKQDNALLDITGYSVAGELKENFRATTGISFTAEITSAPDGVFSLKLSDVVTADMDPGTWVYDVVLTNTSGEKTRLLQGNAFVKPGVTA